jgi:protein TonB
MTSMAGTVRRPTTRDPGEGLFSDVLVESQRPKASRWQKIGNRLSIALHLVALALIVFVPIFMPSPLPDAPDVLVSLIYNPPPPPPPPLPKGSNLRPQEANPKPPEPVVDTRPKERFTAPIQTPVPHNVEIKPEQGVRPEDQFGSELGSDLGDALGMEDGVEGGVPGGVPGGVVGGCVGCTGNGPVMDYDAPPKAIKLTKPVYPQEAFVKKIEGTVLVEILIDSSGRVIRARVMQSIPLLDAAAIQTVHQWVFQPAVKHGRPVATIAQAPVTFRIF